MVLKSLVTGGCGFIGSNLALELEKRGHEVTVFDHQLNAKKNLTNFRGKVVELDVARPFQRDGLQFDYIFHQAALTDPRHSDDREIYEKNIVGFTNMVELCRETGARLIYASTAGLYGNGPVPMREDQPKQILTEYGRSKLEMDEQAKKLFEEFPIIGLRYFNVYGPREAHKGRPASMIYHLYHQMKRGTAPRLFKFGEHKRDFIYVNDVVSANIAAMTAPSGVYNVGTGIGSTFNELVAILNEVLGTKLATEYIEMPFADSTYQGNTVADVALAKEKLKFAASWSFPAGVDDYVQWLESQTNA